MADFNQIIRQTEDYFAHLEIDMQIAWAILGLGFILIIVGIFLM